jgi:hypothetical protein
LLAAEPLVGVAELAVPGAATFAEARVSGTEPLLAKAAHGFEVDSIVIKSGGRLQLVPPQ